MAVVSDREIKELIKQGKLKVEPLTEEQIQGAWIDLRLGNEFRIFVADALKLIDVKKEVKGYTRLVEVKDGEPFLLNPGDFCLASVKEYLELPSDLMGMIDGRSSLGRLGIIIHSTSAGVEPGWKGKLTLEISNAGKLPVLLYPGMRVCKLVLHKLTSPAEKPSYARKDAKYHEQVGIMESQIFKDFKE